MEVLAGARDEQHLRQLRRLLACALVIQTGPIHYEGAAALYRACRREGETVRVSSVPLPFALLYLSSTQTPPHRHRLRHSCAPRRIEDRACVAVFPMQLN